MEGGFLYIGTVYKVQGSLKFKNLELSPPLGLNGQGGGGEW